MIDSRFIRVERNRYGDIGYLAYGVYRDHAVQLSGRARVEHHYRDDDVRWRRDLLDWIDYISQRMGFKPSDPVYYAPYPDPVGSIADVIAGTLKEPR